MTDKLDLTSLDIVSENVKKIAELFPNCVTETANGIGIDFDLLKQELNSEIVDGYKERYRIEWPGKREAIVTANLPTTKTLRPVREDSVDFDNTENLYIEGDNLEVLKLLQESYLDKIKVIYIDPPYNTGSDFIYSDNFTIGNEEFKSESGLIDEFNNKLLANPDTAGRYHSDWLSMIYPRLKLARNLLSNEGIIFVSIGVEEISNLKKVMDEIFGESNFIEIFSWVKTSTPPALSTKSRKTNEYILCYDKSWTPFKYQGELLDGGDQPLLNSGNSLRTLKIPKDKVRFSSKHFPNGVYSPSQPDRVKLLNTIEIHNGYSKTDIELEGEFKWTQAFLDEEIAKGTTFIIKSNALSIRFIREGEGFKRPTNFIKEKYITPVLNKKVDGIGTNENASSELNELMGKDVFSYPKPVSLIKHLINFNLKENDIVMDFFSGSGTTADAVMNWTVSNESNLKYILVQLPVSLEENLKKADANTRKIIQNGIDLLNELNKPLYITELAKERIRRASNNYNQSKISNLDVGFRVFKLAESNMKDVYYRPQDFKQEQLDVFSDNIKPDRTADDLLAQIMLDWGLPLSLKIEQLTIDKMQVFKVAENSLLACFDNGLNEAFAKEIAKLKPLRVVFKDSSFEDNSAKENVKQLLKQLSPETEMKVI